MNPVSSNNLILKYQIFTPSGCKDIGIRKFEFRAKTQFLKVKKFLNMSCQNILKTWLNLEEPLDPSQGLVWGRIRLERRIDPAPSLIFPFSGVNPTRRIQDPWILKKRIKFFGFSSLFSIYFINMIIWLNLIYGLNFTKMHNSRLI